MNDSKRSTLGQTSHPEAPVSDREAVRITQHENVPELVAFIIALQMGRRISTDKAARLLEHMVKEQMSTDAGLIADQMRSDHWEADLSDGETLIVLAQRALGYLATDDGVALFNFFVKTFAGTSGDMFD
ncbi:MAG: hypothetical protein H7327_16255 [Herminiimonas sp.]|nr:hypothetical protein [Herminiimonas sp.]